MQITKNQLKLSKLVSKDKSKELLQSILHDGKKSVVTNGHYLIINENTTLPETDIKDPVLLRGKPLQGLKNDCFVDNHDEGQPIEILDQNGSSSIKIEKTEGRFPNYRQVIPQKVTPFFKVDARYLRSICDYVINCTEKKEMPSITFSLVNEPDTQNYPITIDFKDKNQAIKAVLMPVRM